MSAIGIAALMAAGFVWLSSPTPPPTSPHVVLRSNFWITLNLGGYTIPHTSPIFWVIVGGLLVVVLGIIAAFVRAVSAFARAGTPDA
jgi:hypothetical protein